MAATKPSTLQMTSVDIWTVNTRALRTRKDWATYYAIAKDNSPWTRRQNVNCAFWSYQHSPNYGAISVNITRSCLCSLCHRI